MALTTTLGVNGLTLVDDGPFYAQEEKWEGEDQVVVSPAGEIQPLVVRETPRWKVREHSAKIKLFKHHQQLQRELLEGDRIDFHDPDLAPLPTKAEKTGLWAKIERFADICGVWFCHSFHRMERYEPGDTFWICACSRKYAVPFADQKKIPLGVYVHTPMSMPTERTMQAEIRGAHARVINAEKK